ncbi:MAG: zf-HC2 domain-containing protein [Phycisphaerales bacterium]|jgi:predicted anti-sigma-YlaC factor YlaD|nr:zf-HC2 domain-containing protein [Phycisphaerales bacterium]
MAGHEAMNCREFSVFLMLYLEGELPPDVAEHFRGHLEACGDCRAFMECYKRTISMAKMCKCEQSRNAVPEDLVRAILQARGNVRA